MAAIPFSILAALAFAEAARYGGRLLPVAPALLAVVALGVLALYGWQTWEQDQVIADASADWRSLVTSLEAKHLEFPAGSRVYVRGGPLTEPLAQLTVMPAAGAVLWGDVELFSVPEGASPLCVRDGYPTYFFEFNDGHPTLTGVRMPVDTSRPVAYSFPPPVPPVCSEKVAVP